MKKATVTPVSVELIQKLDQLSDQRQNFEQNDLRGSNKKLYEILSNIYSIYTEISDQKKVSKSTFEEMKKILKERGVKVQKNSPALTVLIRYVFKSDRTRSYNYNRVIQSAIQKQITPENLSDYIEECGGIEECKKQFVKSEKTIKKEHEYTDRVQLVRDNINNFESIFTVNVGDEFIEPQPDCDLIFCVGRKSLDGNSIEFFHVIKSMNKTMEKTSWKLISKDLYEMLKISEEKSNEIMDEMMS